MRKTSWDQFISAGLIGIGVLLYLAMVAFYPPAIILTLWAFIFWWLFTAGNRRANKPHARALPDGKWQVYLDDDTPVGDPCSHADAQNMLLHIAEHEQRRKDGRH